MNNDVLNTLGFQVFYDKMESAESDSQKNLEKLVQERTEKLAETNNEPRKKIGERERITGELRQAQKYTQN